MVSRAVLSWILSANLSSKYVADALSVLERGGWALEGGLVGVQTVRTSIRSTAKAVRANMVPKYDTRVYENFRTPEGAPENQSVSFGF
jgi:hypothetical protein